MEPVKMGVILTSEQLINHTKQINAMNGIDFNKINEQMKEQISKENKILKGFLINSISNIELIIKEKEDKKEFFEYKIKNLNANDNRLIEYEKEIFLIQKEIKELKESMEQTNENIKNLN